MVALLSTALGVVLQVAPALPPPSPPPADAAAWRVLKTVEGVTLREAPSGAPKAPWGMGEGEIAAPLDRVIAHVTDFPALLKYVPKLEKLQVLQQGDGTAVVYFRFDLPWPVSDRDWTVRYWFGLDGAGHFRMQWTDANELGPPPHRVVRVSPVRGVWELSPTPRGTTWARYVFLAELGGSIPMGVVEQTVWKQPLYTILGIRRALASALAPLASRVEASPPPRAPSTDRK